MFIIPRWGNCSDAGVLGCALQNTYTFSAKGLLQSDFNRQKSLENFSLPLVTLSKGFELTHNITPPLLHLFSGTQKQYLNGALAQLKKKKKKTSLETGPATQKYTQYISKSDITTA